MASLAQPLGPVHSFTSTKAAAPTRSNAQMVQDFLDLSFQLESGTEIQRMTRFNGPITVGVSGSITEQMLRDLNSLLARLQAEAGLDIRYSAETNPTITIEAVPLKTLQRAVPSAACFVMPGIDSWAEFLRAKNAPKSDWASLETRDKAVIFLPADAPAQEVRDCLHEELAQALGPLNDLYRLPDSVFNDDNVHSVLTGFDMLMLRAYYAPELANGMTRSEAAERLPALFSRLNPNGDTQKDKPLSPTSRDWTIAIEAAYFPRLGDDQRRASATQAIAIARMQDWSDVREGFAYYTFGRLAISHDPVKAEQAFLAAETIFLKNPQTTLHASHLAAQLAGFALSRGETVRVTKLADQSIPVARAHENAALLAVLMMFKAEALDMQGNSDAAQRLRLDSLGWARYGFSYLGHFTAYFAHGANKAIAWINCNGLLFSP